MLIRHYKHIMIILLRFGNGADIWSCFRVWSMWITNPQGIKSGMEHPDQHGLRMVLISVCGLQIHEQLSPGWNIRTNMSYELCGGNLYKYFSVGLFKLYPLFWINPEFKRCSYIVLAFFKSPAFSNSFLWDSISFLKLSVMLFCFGLLI